MKNAVSQAMHLALTRQAILAEPKFIKGKGLTHAQLNRAGISTSRGKPHSRQSAHRVQAELGKLSQYELEALDAIASVLDQNCIYDSESLASFLES